MRAIDGELSPLLRFKPGATLDLGHRSGSLPSKPMPNERESAALRSFPLFAPSCAAAATVQEAGKCGKGMIR